MPHLRNHAGKVKISTLVLLLVVAGGVYYGLAFGGVYWRRYRVGDVMDTQLAYAGQIADETIRDQMVQKLSAMKLPPAARRVRMSRTGARTIQVSISYRETVNLLYGKKEIPVSITKRRTY